MSKLTKLIKNPSAFFADYIKKNQETIVVSKLVNSFPSLNSFADKYATNKTSVTTKSAVNLKYHMNFFKKHVAILNSGEGAKAGLAHLSLWIPSFIESNIEFIVLVRNEALFNAVEKEYPWLNLVFAKRLIDVESLVTKMPFLTTVFYVSITGSDIHLVRRSYLNHIFLGHGDSDKSASAHKVFRLYDEVWTAGEAHIDRFKNADFNTKHISFKKIGRPTLFKVINECKDSWTERKIKILYLPTWEGVVKDANYSSILISPQIIELISRKLSISISTKYHPATGTKDIAYKNIETQLNSSFPSQTKNINIIDKSVPLDNIISQHNVFICDISGVVSDCLAANGPIFIYIPKDKTLNISTSNMRYEEYCYAFSDLDELESLLSEVLSGNDYLKEKREKAVDYLIGYEETLNKEFINQLKSLGETENVALPSRTFDL